MLYISENKQALVNRMSSIITGAMVDGRITKLILAGGINVYCCGAFLTIGEDSYPTLIGKINKSMGHTPWIGLISFGETGYYIGWVCLHCSVMLSVVLFGK